MRDLEDIKKEILQSVTIQDIIERYTSNKIQHNRCKCFSCIGNQLRTMSLDKGYAYCFRCGNNYNQIQAVMEINKYDFATACRAIIADFKLNIEMDRPLTQQEKKQALKRKLEHEKEEQRKLAKETYKRKISNDICDKIRKCEKYIFEHGNKPIEYYEQNEKVATNIMICQQELKRLDWLYAKINHLIRDENCEYEYTMPSESIDVLRQLYLGKIKV